MVKKTTINKQGVLKERNREKKTRKNKNQIQ